MPRNTQTISELNLFAPKAKLKRLSICILQWLLTKRGEMDSRSQVDEKEICFICTEDYDDTDHQIVSLPCCADHKLCFTCYKRMCNASVTEKRGRKCPYCFTRLPGSHWSGIRDKSFINFNQTPG
jgi:hypothetical protein